MTLRNTFKLRVLINSKRRENLTSSIYNIIDFASFN